MSDTQPDDEDDKYRAEAKRAQKWYDDGDWQIQELDHGAGWRSVGWRFTWLASGKKQIQAQAQPERYRIVDQFGSVKFVGESKDGVQLAEIDRGGTAFVLEVVVLTQTGESTEQSWECLDMFATLKEAYSAANQLNLQPGNFRVVEKVEKKQV